MDNKNQNDDIISNLRFSVMPDLEGIGRAVQKSAPVPLPTAPAPAPRPAASPGGTTPQAPSPAPMPRPNQPQPPAQLTEEIRERHSNVLEGRGHFDFIHSKKFLIISLSAIALLLIIIAAMFFVRAERSETEADTEVPVIDKTPVAEEPVVEDTVDTDADGLLDTEEDKINTDANLADTDGDGLADGDEVNVFQSSPFTAHSDNDNFDDGKELRDGYSILIGGDGRLTDADIQQIKYLLESGDLHEPTVTKLMSSDFWKSRVNLAPPTPANGSKFTYEDPIYNYQVVLPGSWTVTGRNSPNVFFTEVDSKDARYLQVQAHVGVSGEGEVSDAGLLEAEVKRLAGIAMNGVKLVKVALGGREAYKMQFETQRTASDPTAPGMNTVIIEYIVSGTDASFIVTLSCTSTTANCGPSLEQFSKTVEENLRF